MNIYDVYDEEDDDGEYEEDFDEEDDEDDYDDIDGGIRMAPPVSKNNNLEPSGGIRNSSFPNLNTLLKHDDHIREKKDNFSRHSSDTDDDGLRG